MRRRDVRSPEGGDKDGEHFVRGYWVTCTQQHGPLRVDAVVWDTDNRIGV
jgi:hypothetical protein